MNSKTIRDFLEDAENYLPTIRCEILLCSQEGISGSELETSLRYIEAIKEAALEAGLHEIVRVAQKLERELGSAVRTRQMLSTAQARKLLDDLAELEALLMKQQFEAEEFALNISNFIDESFASIGLGTPKAEAAPAEADNEYFLDLEEDFEFEGFEIDEEMLEVFAIEAEDLLRDIGSHLKVLESNPNDRDSLLEIRRSAHTLKGSAGIVGLKMLSGLAHQVEDLLHYLAENEIEGDRKIFELLLKSTDCLSVLATGEKSQQLAEKVSLLHREFRDTLKSLQNEPARLPSARPAEEPEAAVSPAAAGADAGDNSAAAGQNRSVVRVSLEKLDDLVKLVSDLIISRSVFEQRLKEFQQQVGELRHVTGRLVHSTGKLETDFEAGMMGTGLEPWKERHGRPGTRGVVQAADISGQTRPGLTSPQFDALEFDRYTEFHQTTRQLLEIVNDTGSVNLELDLLRAGLELLFEEQSRLIEEMHDKLLHLRMVKFGTLAARLQRTVRVTCEQEGKWADLFIEGEAVEVDTQILDALVEPLLHLLRNAVAHGIEPPDTRRLLGKPEVGRIDLRLYSEGTHIVLAVSDDGRGISASGLKEKAVQNGFITPAEADAMTDDEAFSLAFLPGVTTAESISQVAGRGVGMNIIRNNILRQQGSISINSEPQKGTTFEIRLPMALAVTRGILVRARNQVFAFPTRLIRQISEIPAERAADAVRRGSLVLDGILYRPVYLNEALNLPSPSESTREMTPLLLLETLDSPCALLVDDVLRTDEMVIKPLGAPLRNLAGLLGATILGDGSVVPVLDLLYLLKNRPPVPVSRGQAPAPAAALPEPEELSLELDFLCGKDTKPGSPEPKSRRRVMVVDDSPSVRHITSKLIESAGWEVVTARDGLEALAVLQRADERIHIILTDVEMPRMDGYELLAALKSRESFRHIPVVMITSRAGEKHRQKAIELGVSDYLTKPFSDHALVETIKILTGNQ